MALDQSIMDLYLDDDILPDLHHGVFEDHKSKTNCVFSEEMAGFMEHPADLLCGDKHSTKPIVLLEKMGVSDPEGVKLSGQLLLPRH